MIQPQTEPAKCLLCGAQPHSAQKPLRKTRQGEQGESKGRWRRASRLRVQQLLLNLVILMAAGFWEGGRGTLGAEGGTGGYLHSLPCAPATPHPTTLLLS